MTQMIRGLTSLALYIWPSDSDLPYLDPNSNKFEIWDSRNRFWSPGISILRSWGPQCEVVRCRRGSMPGI